MKKGQLSSIGKVLIALFIAGILIYFIFNVVGKVGRSNQDLQDMFGTKLLQLKLEYGGSNTEDPCQGLTTADSVRIIREAAGMVGNPPFEDFEEFLLAIASVESDYYHCKDGELLRADGSTAVGVMQITQTTGKGVCGQEDFSNIVDNAVCGALIVIDKHDKFSDDDTYESKVRSNCDNPEWREEYLSYDDPMRRTARAYNGFGCPSAKEVAYVDDVMDALDEKPWTKI